MFVMYSRLLSVSDTAFVSCISQPNLHKWLSDEKARDQLVIRAGTSTAVYWKDVVPELVYQKQIPYFYSLIAEK